MSALLERERELAELETLAGEACDGSGRFAVIEAAAGLGKTRLLQATRDAGQSAGMRVLAARATELERDFPFALVRQLFDPPLAALDAPAREELFEGAAGAARSALGTAATGSSSSDTFAVLLGLYWLTAALAEQEPLLLAVDDAHWSDAASLDYLGFLLPRLEELPVLLVMTCRPDEAGAESSLARIATDTLARRLVPHALSRAAAGALLAAELGAQPDDAFTATCHEVSGGNPFLLCELARTLVVQEIRPDAAPIPRVRELSPERVTRTVLVRLARLPAEARAVARALAVLGDDADHRLVAQLSGLSADAVLTSADELRNAAILDAGAPLRFIHPLVRTALQSDLPAGERAEAHARAAALLRERGASAEQLAGHLLATEASGSRATVETLVEAGGRALASGASRSAIAYLMRALREPPPADLRPGVLGPLLSAGMRAMDASVFASIEPDVLAELERDPRLVGAWAGEIAPWMAIDRRIDAAGEMLEAAIAVLDRAGDIDRALHLEGQLIAYLQLDPTAARERLAPYRDRVASGGAGDRLLAAFDAAWCLFDGCATEAAPLARRALDEGRIFVEQAELLVPGEVLRTAILAGDLDTAQQATDQALVLARERGGRWDQTGAWYLHAHVALARGDLGAAAADVQQLRAIAGTRGILASVPMATAIAVAVQLERGDLEASQAELAASSAAAGAIEDLPVFDPLLFARAELQLARGHARQAADDFLLLAERRSRRGTSTSPIIQSEAYAARALAVLGEYERARELAESGSPWRGAGVARARSHGRCAPCRSRRQGRLRSSRWRRPSRCSTALPRGWSERMHWPTSAPHCAAPTIARMRARHCARRSSSRGAAEPAASPSVRPTSCRRRARRCGATRRSASSRSPRASGASPRWPRAA